MPGESDEFSITVTSEKTGTKLYDTFRLIVQLEDYPSSTPASFDVRISYRECFPYDFSGPKLDDMIIEIGGTSESLDIYFD